MIVHPLCVGEVDLGVEDGIVLGWVVNRHRKDEVTLVESVVIQQWQPCVTLTKVNNPINIDDDCDAAI